MLGTFEIESDEDEMLDGLEEEKLDDMEIWPDGFRSDHSLYYPEN